MSNFLAIDTSSRYLCVTAAKNGAFAEVFEEDCALRHSVRLMQAVEEAMDKISLSPDECDFFAAVTGPGSFTGIRIGLSAAKGFAVATGKPACGLTVFDMIAYNVKDIDFGVAVDAAHGFYYYKGYGKFACEPAYLDGAAVLSKGATLYGFEDLPLANYVKTDIRGCLKNAVCGGAANGAPVALYVRKSQAEEGRK